VTTFALAPGEARVIQAKASQDTATFRWTLNGEVLSSENTVTVRGKDEEIGHYAVTATVGTEHSEPAALEVTLAPEDEPAVWHKDFAVVAASVLGGLVFLLSIPGYVIAFRAAIGKDNAAQVVAMFLVLPGLLALGVGSFLLLLDYRGRMVNKRAALEVRAAAEGLPAPDKVIAAISEALGTFTKATRGAAALVFAAVAIFGFAAWAAVGGDSPASPTPTPTPGTSSQPSPSPSSSASLPASPSPTS